MVNLFLLDKRLAAILPEQGEPLLAACRGVAAELTVSMAKETGHIDAGVFRSRLFGALTALLDNGLEPTLRDKVALKVYPHNDGTETVYLDLTD